jgi:hypothetical protein
MNQGEIIGQLRAYNYLSRDICARHIGQTCGNRVDCDMFSPISSHKLMHHRVFGLIEVPLRANAAERIFMATSSMISVLWSLACASSWTSVVAFWQ